MNEIERAVGSLRTGGVVAFPTETVGLGADARNQDPVRRIFTIKEHPRRPSFNRTSGLGQLGGRMGRRDSGNGASPDGALLGRAAYLGTAGAR